jgi:type I restriction enzyme S subunit
MSKLIKTSWGKLGTLFDGPHATPRRIDEGPYFLNIASLKSGRLDLSESDHVSPEEFAQWTRRVAPEENDLLFSYETRLGEAALMPAGVKACLGRRMALLRPDRDVVDPRFLLYYYLSPVFQSMIQERAIHGATVDRIGLATMPDWPVTIPCLPTQRAISEMLGALDDKIAANDVAVDLSDQLATALTRRALDGSTAPLSSLAELTMGSSPPGSSYNAEADGLPFFQGVRDFGVRSPGRRVWTTAPVRTAEAGDTLISVRAPVGRVNVAAERLCLGRGLAGARSRLGTPNTLFHQIRAADSEWAPFEAVGTVFGAINRNQLASIAVPAVTEPQRAGLEAQLKAVEDGIRAMLTENARLAATRNELLPLLMSGKVRVRDVERRVSDAL